MKNRKGMSCVRLKVENSSDILIIDPEDEMKKMYGVDDTTLDVLKKKEQQLNKVSMLEQESRFRKVK